MAIDLEVLAKYNLRDAVPRTTDDSVDAAGEVHPDFLVIRSEDWASKSGLPFDRTPPPTRRFRDADRGPAMWNWCRRAWTTLLAPQLALLEERTLRESEPFVFGYLSGAPAALVDLLELDPNGSLARSIIVGTHADVFGAECLFEAHQLCEAITAAGPFWPGLTRINNFETGWKVGYVEMVDLLSGDSPAGLLGRFLAERTALEDHKWMVKE